MSFQAEYKTWAKSAGFISKLPDDSTARKAAENEAAAKLQQGRVDQHFPTAKPSDKVDPYSDALFRDAAVQWLIQTDQVSNK